MQLEFQFQIVQKSHNINNIPTTSSSSIGILPFFVFVVLFASQCPRTYINKAASRLSGSFGSSSKTNMTVRFWANAVNAMNTEKNRGKWAEKKLTELESWEAYVGIGNLRKSGIRIHQIPHWIRQVLVPSKDHRPPNPLGKARSLGKKDHRNHLVGGWTNPSKKYDRQIGSFPQVGVKIENVWNHHLVTYDHTNHSTSDCVCRVFLDIVKRVSACRRYGSRRLGDDPNTT